MAEPRRMGQSIAGAAAMIAVITLVSRLVGFGRWLEFSRSVGATCTGTVYQSTNAIPNVLYEVAAGGAVAAIAVPLIAGHLGAGDRAKASQTSSALLTWVVLICAPLSLVVALAAVPLSALLVSGDLCPGAASSAALMLAVFAPQILLYGIGAVLAGVLQAHRRFLAVALAPLLSSLVVIGTYAAYGRMEAGPETGVRFLAVGTTLGVAVLSLPLAGPAARLGLALRPTVRFPPGVAPRARALAAAGVAGVLAQQVAVVATLVVANRAGVGVVTVYMYAQAVYLLPYAALAVPVAVAAFPVLASAREPGVLARALTTTVVIGWGSVGLLVATARPIGAFFASLDAGRASPAGAEALAALPMALAAYAPGLAGLCVVAVAARALYIRGQARTAAAATAAGWLVAALVPLALVRPGSTAQEALVTLGLSSSAGMLGSAALLVVAVRRSGAEGDLPGLPRSVAVGAVAAALVATVGVLLSGRWPTHGLLASAVGTVVIGAVALVGYGALLTVGDRAAAAPVARRVRGLLRAGGRPS